MTDADGCPPRPDGIATAERQRLLRQIASALGLPVTAFRSRPAPDEAGGPTSAECSALLAAFCRIRDPQARAFCLRVLETFARD